MGRVGKFEATFSHLGCFTESLKYLCHGGSARPISIKCPTKVSKVSIDIMLQLWRQSNICFVHVSCFKTPISMFYVSDGNIMPIGAQLKVKGILVLTSLVFLKPILRSFVNTLSRTWWKISPEVLTWCFRACQWFLGTAFQLQLDTIISLRLFSISL